jgi:hypothetical protein
MVINTYSLDDRPNDNLYIQFCPNYYGLSQETNQIMLLSEFF